MSVDPPPRRALPPIMLPAARTASAWRPGALWAAAIRIGIARGYIPAAVAARITPVEAGPPAAPAPVSISPTTPLPTTQTIVIPVKPATAPPAPTPAAHVAPAPVEAAAPAAVHVVPRAGMGVHPV
ncbi:MAG: hypothetical protein RXR82_06010 [Nitrososphaeria archaeon]